MRWRDAWWRHETTSTVHVGLRAGACRTSRVHPVCTCTTHVADLRLVHRTNHRENAILRIGTGVASVDVMSGTPENALAPDLAAKAALSEVVFGSCLCGDVGYRITGFPLRVIGHTGIHMPYLFVPVRQFRWTSGRDRVVSNRTLTSAETAHCRRCGAAVPREGARVVVVPKEPEPAE